LGLGLFVTWVRAGPVPVLIQQEDVMSRIVVTEFVSLDGVMEEPRWTFQFERGPDGDKFKFDELFEADALLLGRVTYQGFAQAWPSMGHDDFGKRMNEIPKYVVSSTLANADATWGETTVIRDDVVARITALKAGPGGNLLVEGSAQLVHLLAQHGLVDEYRLMVFPVILGGGKRAYPAEMSQPGTLALTKSQVAGDGILLLNYEPAEAKEATGLPGQPDPTA
jgi:dihydrofolate reductase